jgi:hypothetical protein
VVIKALGRGVRREFTYWDTRAEYVLGRAVACVLELYGLVGREWAMELAHGRVRVNVTHESLTSNEGNRYNIIPEIVDKSPAILGANELEYSFTFPPRFRRRGSLSITDLRDDEPYRNGHSHIGPEVVGDVDMARALHQSNSDMLRSTHPLYRHSVDTQGKTWLLLGIPSSDGRPLQVQSTTSGAFFIPELDRYGVPIENWAQAVYDVSVLLRIKFGVDKGIPCTMTLLLDGYIACVDFVSDGPDHVWMNGKSAWIGGGVDDIGTGDFQRVLSDGHDVHPAYTWECFFDKANRDDCLRGSFYLAYSAQSVDAYPYNDYMARRSVPGVRQYFLRRSSTFASASAPALRSQHLARRTMSQVAAGTA